MQMLPHNARAGERGQFGDTATLGALPRQLEDDGALARDGVLPDLSGFDRRKVSRSRRIRMRHTPIVPGRPRAASRRVRCAELARIFEAIVTWWTTAFRIHPVLRTGVAAALLQQSFDHYDDSVPLQSVWEVEPGEARHRCAGSAALPKPGGTPRSRRTSARDALVLSRGSGTGGVARSA
jgi:hypothetical protein